MLMCHMLYLNLNLFKHTSHPKFLSGFKYVGGGSGALTPHIVTGSG